jgi:hypothetical protein
MDIYYICIYIYIYVYVCKSLRITRKEDLPDPGGPRTRVILPGRIRPDDDNDNDDDNDDDNDIYLGLQHGKGFYNLVSMSYVKHINPASEA